MLHIMPFRLSLQLAAVLMGLAVLTGVSVGFVGTEGFISDARKVIQISAAAALLAAIAPYVAWRWIPALRRMTFPYLGGSWVGEIKFAPETKKDPGKRDVTLEIFHSAFQLRLILHSKESTSRTLVVRAERDDGVNTNRVYYAFRNERKEGYRNPPTSGLPNEYLGLAILRADVAGKPTLRGEYFTDQQRYGTLMLTLKKPNRWWQLWK